MITYLRKIGDVPAVNSLDVKESPIGIGFEKLDRNVFDPEKAYDKVAAIGVKWIRIQSGWARTEQTKGVYSFEWLDTIIDNLLARGLRPWMCLCYGNGLYDEKAAKVYGAVGCPPIHTTEQKNAWSNYVAAVTERYRGKVDWFEIWNEPDGSWCWKHGPSGTEYGNFVQDTAKAIKTGNPEAKIIGGSCCLKDFEWMNEVFRTGAVKVMDAFSFHNYTIDEQESFKTVAGIKELCRLYNPKMEVIQGETGTQSRSDGAGALRGGAWNPKRQAKSLLRTTMTDLMLQVKFTSYFSCMDMIEALNGDVNEKETWQDYGYFGVLAADFDENGFSTGEYSPKPSYRTLQVIASIFREKFSVEQLPIRFYELHSDRIFGKDDPGKEITCCGFRKPNGSAGFVYWHSTNMLKYTYESTISLGAVMLPGKVQLIDLLDGSIYELGEKQLIDNQCGFRLFRNIPVFDYPLLLTFGDFIDASETVGKESRIY